MHSTVIIDAATETLYTIKSQHDNPAFVSNLTWYKKRHKNRKADLANMVFKFAGAKSVSTARIGPARQPAFIANITRYKKKKPI